MSLVPVDRQTGRKRETSERDRHYLREEKKKADFYNRNPHKKWND